MYEFYANVLEVVDGDTIWVMLDQAFRDYKKMKFRLHLIQAPEINSKDPEIREAGLRSKTYLESVIPVGTKVKIKSFKDVRSDNRYPMTYDRYDAWVTLEDGTNLSQLMLDMGMATLY